MIPNGEVNISEASNQRDLEEKNLKGSSFVSSFEGMHSDYESSSKVQNNTLNSMMTNRHRLYLQGPNLFHYFTCFHFA